MTALVALDVQIPLFSASWWKVNGVALAATLLIAIALTAITRHYVRRFRKRAASAGDDHEGRRERRVATVVGLIAGVLVVIAWFVFVLEFLSSLGVNTAAIVASAGIAGVALGFGAQTLVRDTISRAVHLPGGAIRRRRRRRPHVDERNRLRHGRAAVDPHERRPAVRRDALDRPERRDRDHEQPHTRLGPGDRRPPRRAVGGSRPGPPGPRRAVRRAGAASSRSRTGSASGRRCSG